MTTDFSLPPFDLTNARPTTQHTNYIIDPALYNAVQVAILLQQPLLLTGEPGTGKTRLAEELATRLSQQPDANFLSQPLVFHTKTTSTFTDLFYTYDALGHFHAAHFDDTDRMPKSGMKPMTQQSLDKDGPVMGKLTTLSQSNGSPQASAFVQLQALGQAILLSNATALAEYSQRSRAYLSMNNVLIDRPRSSVVLIDEVDKAPRDFANDLLNELDRFEFCVREDRNRTYCKGEGNVIVILTSNSEKNLPDAFLRRCIFYHIDFPNEDQLLAIVKGQLFTATDKEDEKNNQEQEDNINARLKEYIGVFAGIRKENSKKPPATAELISWIFFLRKYVLGNVPYNAIDKDIRRAGNSILAKHKEDLLALNAPLTA